MTKPRTLPQSARFHAICTDVARQCPLVPWKRAMWCEAWKRYLLALYVHHARLEAYGAGRPDPYPVRPVPSSILTSEQMSDLIEASSAWAAENGIVLLK